MCMLCVCVYICMYVCMYKTDYTMQISIQKYKILWLMHIYPNDLPKRRWLRLYDATRCPNQDDILTFNRLEHLKYDGDLM